MRGLGHGADSIQLATAEPRRTIRAVAQYLPTRKVMPKHNGNPEPVPMMAAPTAMHATPEPAYEPQAARDAGESAQIFHEHSAGSAVAGELQRQPGRSADRARQPDHLTGYNGTPENMVNCLMGMLSLRHRDKSYKSGDAYDLCICVHAGKMRSGGGAIWYFAAGSTMYTTCVHASGCAKEMLQARVRSVYYLHEWNPSAKGRRLKTAARTAEYEKLMIRFPGCVYHLEVPDPDVNWAVSRKTPATLSLDHHRSRGHLAMKVSIRRMAGCEAISGAAWLRLRGTGEAPVAT
jgi:dCMP deaminase